MTFSEKYDVIIVGAGMSGITAGNFLQEKGLKVKLLDKGKGIGGRLATRRIQYKGEKVVFDYGAHYLFGKSNAFKKVLEDLYQKDILRIWNMNGAETEKKYVGKKSIREIAVYLSNNLNIFNSCRVTQIIRNNEKWILSTDINNEYISDKIIITMPVPQSLDLLDHSKIKIDSKIKSRLAEVKYERSIAALLILENGSIINGGGLLKLNKGPISFITDNNKKGINTGRTALTIEMNNNFSMKYWNSSDNEIIKNIIDLAEDWLGAPVLDYQIHKWKYSRPSKIYDKRFVFIDNPATLYLAGDAFQGNNVESAYHSGLSAAEHLYENWNVN